MKRIGCFRAILTDGKQWINKYSELWAKRVTPKDTPEDISEVLKHCLVV